jgi:hypothetical protein
MRIAAIIQKANTDIKSMKNLKMEVSVLNMAFRLSLN